MIHFIEGICPSNKKEPIFIATLQLFHFIQISVNEFHFGLPISFTETFDTQNGNHGVSSMLAGGSTLYFLGLQTIFTIFDMLP